MSYAFRKIMPRIDLQEMEPGRGAALTAFARAQQDQIAAEVYCGLRKTDRAIRAPAHHDP